MPRPTPPPQQKRLSRVPRTTEDVDPRWLLKALAVVTLFAAVCGYATLCLLFYQGQWQLVLHPTRTTSQPPVTGAELVHFAPDESAIPQLTGWWIPAAPSSRYSQTTILYLPPGDGSLADSAPLLTTLHTLGINIFAIDYRGYGQSAATRPSQKNMLEDAENTWRYLTTSRAIPSRHIIPYGVGVATSLAAHLATIHPEAPALILESPQADLLQTAKQDPRAKLVPTSLLFHENFPLSDPLSTLKTPKLLLSITTLSAAFKTAADPKATVEFNAAQGLLYTQPAYPQTITRFLDQYLATAPQTLHMTPPQP